MKKLAVTILALGLSACAKPDSSTPYNSNAMFTDTSSKTEVTCPAQTASTQVLFAFGQSNSANWDENLYQNTDARIINYYQGHCYIAQDPMLGATGSLGSVWVPVAQRVLNNGADYVILATAGYGGSFVGWWADGQLTSEYDQRLADVGSKYQVTKFLWHQGEADSTLATPSAQYSASLNQVIARAQSSAPQAKFYVSVATICQDQPDALIEQAQAAAVNGVTVLAGPNSDTIPASMRRDGCHMNAQGQEALAALWAQAIL